MRLPDVQINYIKQQLLKLDGGALLYLFGSRIDDHKKGGDIDLLFLTNERIKGRDIRRFKVGFYQKFGEQKIDVVNFTKLQNHPFKSLALEHAIEL